MKRILMTTGMVALSTQLAYAGGIDRSGQSTSILYEDGNYAEFSLGVVDGSVSGTAVGQASGDVAETYTQLAAGYKWSYGGNWDLAVTFDQPYGADINYDAATTYPLRGTTATFDSTAFTVLGKYNFDGGFSLHGGVKSQSIEMEVGLPAAGYSAAGARENGFGYVIGGAYERPEIALRVALSYHSAIDYSVGTTENGAASLNTDITTPQAINLDVQSGIAADTLLFGSLRWVEWSAFDITPAGFAAANGGASLVSYADDTITGSIGIGRKLSDQWSVAATYTYEGSGGGFQSNLGPTDGRSAFGLGGTYTNGDMKVTFGGQYILPGDAQTIVSATGPITSDFTDNSALAFGVKVGFSM